MRFPLFIILLALSALQTFSTTYYVDAVNGKDTYNGTTTTINDPLLEGPWKTITKVNASSFSAGDFVLLHRGDTHTVGLVVPSSGSVGSVITFADYGSGALPIIALNNICATISSKSAITFDNLVLSNTTGGTTVSLGTVDHFNMNNCTSGRVVANGGTFSDLAFSNLTSTAIATEGIYFNGTLLSNIVVSGFIGTNHTYGLRFVAKLLSSSVIGSTFRGGTQSIRLNEGGNDVIISNVTASGYSGAAIQINGSGSNIIVSGLTSLSNSYGILASASSGEVTNLTLSNCFFGGNTNDGLLLINGGTNCLVSNCVASGNTNDGFGVAYTWGSVIFDHCTATNNGVDGLGSHGDGFSFHDSSSGIIRYCISGNNKKTACAHIGTSIVQMFYNLFYHDTVGSLALVDLSENGTYQLLNNVIWSGGTVGIGVKNGNCTLGITNNVIYGFGTNLWKNGSGTVSEDYNDFYGASSAFVGGSLGAHSLTVDPRFRNPTGKDFELLWVSPMIDRGANIGLTTDFYGNPIINQPDIGAYEYQHKVRTMKLGARNIAIPE